MTRYFLIILFISSILFANNTRRSCLNHSEEFRARPERDAFILSPSGNFHIHYDVEGYNAPDLNDSNTPNGIPDYVDEVALAADNAKEIIVNQLGFLEEVKDEDEIYDIYIKNYSAGVYGYNIPDDNISGASYIEIDNAYEENMYLTSGLNTMRLTVAHEFFHAIQRAYRSSSSFGEGYFWEMSSTWIEDIVVPDGNDYIFWVEDFFEDVNQNISSTDGYSIALFGHYLMNIIGNGNSDIIKKIWERYSEGGSSLDAIKYVLELDYNTSFELCWSDFCSRNYFNGEYQNMDNEIYFHIDQKDVLPIQSLNISLSNPQTINTNIVIEDIFLSNQNSYNNVLKSSNLSQITFDFNPLQSSANLEGFISIIANSGNNLNQIINIQDLNSSIYVAPDDIFYYSISSNINCFVNGNISISNQIEINLGDVNIDDEINILDIIMIVGFILNNSMNQIQFENSDINSDDIINIFDIILLIESIMSFD